MKDEQKTEKGHLGDPTKPGEPIVRLSGTHLVVAFCSVLDTLTENSKELAQKDQLIERLQADSDRKQERIAQLEGIQDNVLKDSDRLDILYDYAKKCERLLIISDTRGIGIADDSARLMQPPLGLNDYHTHLRDAIDAIGSETQEGDKTEE